MTTLALALATVIGLSLGLLGGGGSILTVPVLVYAVGAAPKSAIAMSLVVVGASSLVTAAVHWRLGNVRFRAAAIFGPIAMLGAFVGARLSVFVPEAAQLTLFAFVMVAAGVSMFRSNDRGGARERSGLETAPRIALLAPAALAVGVLTGLVGIGGGFLVVPTLVVLAHVPMRQAVGTSLLVIALNSAAGFAGYAGVVHLDWGFLAGFTAVTVVGALAGAAMTRVVPASALRRAFGIVLLTTSAFVLFKNRAALGIAGARCAPDCAAVVLTH